MTNKKNKNIDIGLFRGKSDHDNLHMSQQQVAKIEGVSRARIRQIEQKALRKLQKLLRTYTIEDFL